MASVRDYITEILSHADVVPQFADSLYVDVPDVSVEPQAIPNGLKGGSTSARLSSLAFGPYTSVDLPPKRRSHFLYEISMEIAEAYEARDIAVDAETIASNLRWLHDKLNLHKHSGPREFLRLGIKALEKHGVEESEDSEETDATEDSAEVDLSTDHIPYKEPEDGEFRWSVDDQKLYVYRKLGNAKQARPQEVCNFEPVLMTEYVIDDAETQTRSWRVHLEQEGRAEPYEVIWHAEDRRPSKVGDTLSDLPVEFVVRPRMHDHVMAATAVLGLDRAERQHEYATTGWVTHEGKPMYILPSMEGAIGADGMDYSLRINPEHLPESAAAVASAELAPYGRGVRPPANDDEKRRAIEALLAVVDSSDTTAKTMAVVLQVLAGPLIPAGAGETPPLLHVRGGTGTYKTSFSTTACSIFGTWIRDLTPPPTTWGSTPTYLQAMVHGTKDLTLLIDDYKSGVVGRAEQVNRMIQQYADRTARGRANTRGGLSLTRLPRGLIMSNGEDVWEHIASGEARTIEFIFGDGEIDLDRLTVAQQAVSEGSLQLFGGAWLHWLAQNWERIFEQKLIRTRRDEWRESLAALQPGAHMRVVTQVAVLGAVGTVLIDFVKEMWPEHSEEVESAVRAAAAMLVGGVEERALLVKEAAPFRQLASALNEAVTAGEAIFKNRGHTFESQQDQTIPAQTFRSVPVVGYHYIERHMEAEKRWVLLTENTAMKFFRNLSRSTALPPNFTWKAVMLDAVERHGGKVADRVRVSIDRTGKMSQLSGVIVPLDEVQNTSSTEGLDAPVTPDAHTDGFTSLTPDLT